MDDVVLAHEPAPSGVPAPAVRTVGVEEELLVADPATGRALPLASALLEHLPDAAVGTYPLTTELQQEQVELASAPHRRVADLAADLRRRRRAADTAARAVGARAVALATSPLPVQPRLTPDARYEAIQELFAVTCDEQLTCGCHVHVGVDGPDEGVAVLDRMRPWLSVLTALATNSPFWDGRETGYAGYRTQAWSRWPGTGPTDLFGSVAGYRGVVDRMLASGVLLDDGMVYFDARLSSRYPTVEIRVADVCLDVEDAALVATLARALVDTAAGEWRDGRPPADVPASLLRLAAWRASRSGVADVLVDPRTLEPRPAATVVAALLEHVAPALAASGDLDAAGARAEHLLAHGTGASVQRQLAARRSRLEDVVAHAAERTIA